MHTGAVCRQLSLLLRDLKPPGLDLLKPELAPYIYLSGLVGIELSRLAPILSSAVPRARTARSALFSGGAALRRVGADNRRSGG
jgi:hypothetical protein